MALLLLDNDPDVYILLGGIGIGTNAPGSELEVVGDVQLSGNIIVGGTVDGVDVAAHAADGTVHFVEAAIDHGAIAGLGDDDHAQYILASGARSMAVLDVTGNITVGGTVDGVDIAAHAADGTIHFVEGAIDHGTIAGLGDDDHAQYVLASGARSMTTLDVTGNITLGGTVDGRDVNGWLGQNVSPAATPTFGATTINGDITVTGNVDGRDVNGWLGQNISAAASPSFTGLTVTNTIVGSVQTAYYAD